MWSGFHLSAHLLTMRVVAKYKWELASLHLACFSYPWFKDGTQLIIIIILLIPFLETKEFRMMFVGRFLFAASSLGLFDCPTENTSICIFNMSLRIIFYFKSEGVINEYSFLHFFVMFLKPSVVTLKKRSQSVVVSHKPFKKAALYLHPSLVSVLKMFCSGSFMLMR